MLYTIAGRERWTGLFGTQLTRTLSDSLLALLSPFHEIFRSRDK
jgi:hypothetical protein